MGISQYLVLATNSEGRFLLVDYAESVFIPSCWYGIAGAWTNLSLPYRRTIAGVGVHGIDQNGSHETNQHPTIVEISHWMTSCGDDEKHGLNLPSKLAKNQLSFPSPSELPTFHAGSPVEEILGEGSEGTNYHHSITGSTCMMRNSLTTAAKECQAATCLLPAEFENSPPFCYCWRRRLGGGTRKPIPYRSPRGRVGVSVGIIRTLPKDPYTRN